MPPAAATYEQLIAAVESTCSRLLLAAVRPEIIERQCEIGLWGYYSHLRISALMGTVLWNGESPDHTQLHHGAKDLLLADTLRNTLREHYLYLRVRSPLPDEPGFMVDYLFPGYEIRRYRVNAERPHIPERMYYDTEVLLPQIAAKHGNK